MSLNLKESVEEVREIIKKLEDPGIEGAEAKKLHESGMKKLEKCLDMITGMKGGIEEVL